MAKNIIRAHPCLSVVPLFVAGREKNFELLRLPGRICFRKELNMAMRKNDPSTKLFTPVSLKGNVDLAQLPRAGVSSDMRKSAKHAPSGNVVAWGLAFKIGKAVLVRDEPVTVKLAPAKSPWLVFLHTSDIRPVEENADGFISPMRGSGQLNEHAADYVLIYADGTEARAEIRRRHQIGSLGRGWGENCFEAVPDKKPQPIPTEADDMHPLAGWGNAQYRGKIDDFGPWVNWLWAWENPHPRKTIVAIRFEPVCGAVLVSAVSAGKASGNPLRWLSRRKAVLTLPKGQKFDPHIDAETGLLKQIKLDMGQVISATPRAMYPNENWAKTYNNKVPEISGQDVLVEYTAHPGAKFHLPGGKTAAVAKLEAGEKSGSIQPVAPASQLVTVKAVEKGSGKKITVKLHIHGQAGEYLPPSVNHRTPNPHWFQDYSVDFTNEGLHHCTYIPGQAQVHLPLGKVYIEISKGFEIQPVRKAFTVTRATKEIAVEIEKVLPWRENGWVSADTHVHFLSPSSALLEGAGEGVNVVNLLASQWGELMTNVGDFDGKTVHGAKEAGGDGEHLVRVGTENRQHIMGHISLLGYDDNIIAPMTTGGLSESAMGDPIEVLLTEWAMRCKRLNGVVVLPHFPNPRCEGAASIVSGNVDAVEMCSGNLLYNGISAYSLSDWYRYLNCGYFVPAVGGTDKMAATWAVGMVRTYAQIAKGREFDYEAWKDSVRAGNTFVTYGPLMEFAVQGKPAGTRIKMNRTGGTVDVTWKLASVTVPMSRVDLIVNGEIRQSKAIRKWEDAGSWSVKIDKSSWLAILVRGHYRDKPEIIAAHSSPVMVELKGSQFLAAADAVTILEQIEGAMAYLDTVSTRAEAKRYKEMRLVLTAAHRELHNRMHQTGHYHAHTPVEDHPEHH